MAKSLLNDKFICIIYLIIIIYLLYLGYKYINSHREGLFSPGNSKWVVGQFNTPGWEEKVCLTRGAAGGSSSQKAKLIDVPWGQSWAKTVEYCLDKPAKCIGMSKSATISAPKVTTYTYGSTERTAALGNNKLPGKFFKDDFGAVGIIQRSNDPDCETTKKQAAAAATESKAAAKGAKWNWSPPYCLPTKDGQIGIAKFTGELKGIAGGAWITSQETNASALNTCLSSDSCGALPTGITKSSSDALKDTIGLGSDSDIDAYNRHGFLYGKSDKCMPKWGNWTQQFIVGVKECNDPVMAEDGSVSFPGIVNAPLNNYQGNKEESAKACFNSTECGPGPNGSTTLSINDLIKDGEYTSAVRHEDAGAGLRGVVTEKNMEKCKPSWNKWETDPTCTGFKSSRQDGQLHVPGSTVLSPISEQTAKNVTEFCTAKVNNCGGPQGPLTNMKKDGGTNSYVMREGSPHPGADEVWGRVSQENDPYCYPKWQKWQKDVAEQGAPATAQCTSYGEGYNQSKLTINNWKQADGTDITREQAVNFCFNPTTMAKSGKDGGSGCSQIYNINGSGNPGYPTGTDGSGVTVTGGDQGIAMNPLTGTIGNPGVGEVWGRVNYSNIDLCKPTWGTDPKNNEKKESRFGIAEYTPKMEFKPGGSWNADISDCMAVMRDLSYASPDQFTWGTDGDLCRDGTCYSATLLKSCTSPASLDGAKYGSFLKRDPEYAGFIKLITTILNPLNIMDIGNNLKGAKQYYFGVSSNEVPGSTNIMKSD